MAFDPEVKAELSKRGLFLCPTCSKPVEDKARMWHVCKGRQRMAAAGQVTKKKKRMATLKEQEREAEARLIAVRRILRQPFKQIAEQMDLPETRVHKVVESNLYKRIFSELNLRLSEKEKAVFEMVEQRMIAASDLAAGRIEEILQEPLGDKTIATIAKLATDVVKMRGHEKPKEQKTQIEVSLSPDTIALMRQADGEMAHVDTIDLDAEDYSHEVEQPAPRAQLPAPPEIVIPDEEIPDPDPASLVEQQEDA